MRALVRLAMNGPGQAIGLVLVSGALSWLLPPLAVISGGLVSLVGLQLGLRAALLVVVGATAALALLAALALSTPAPALATGAALWMPAALLGSGVRRAGTVRVGLQWLTLIAAGGCLLFYAVQADPVSWWRDVLQGYLAQPEVRGALPPEREPAAVAEMLAPMMTGAVAVAVVMTLAASLLLGRWWQSLLYRAGAFGREFRDLGFGPILAVVFGGLLLGGFAGVGLLANMAAVLMMLFALQGVAVVHALAAAHQLNAFWLVLFYGVLLLALPQVSVMLSLIGAADNWVSFRSRAGPPAA